MTVGGLFVEAAASRQDETSDEAKNSNATLQTSSMLLQVSRVKSDEHDDLPTVHLNAIQRHAYTYTSSIL